MMTALMLAATLALSEGIFGTAMRFDVDARKAMGVAIEGNRLYAVSGDDFFVFDVSRPLAPRLMGRTNGIGSARQVAVQNGFAYVTSREYGLWIVDATDPRAPRVRSSRATSASAASGRTASSSWTCATRTARRISRCARPTSLRASSIATAISIPANGEADR